MTDRRASGLGDIGTIGDMDATPQRQDGLAVVGAFLGALALLASVFAVGLAMRAEDDDGGDGPATAGSVEVTLAEFSIEPETIEASTGSSIRVTNAGSVEHNLAVKGTDLVSETIAGGASTSLDVSSLEPGDYTVICAIPGHESAGMVGTLRLGSSSGSQVAHQVSSMSWEEMDEVMKARTAAFPAKTSATGATELAPRVLADGTKEFTLTASVFDWETEPGKTVEAWGYNEQVPGPTLRVGVGEKVRIVVRNELPESTALHAHGMILPNAMDGVPDITQPPIHPGEEFVYEWVTREPMVGMYHSHHNAAKQVTNGLLGAFYVGEMPLPAGVPEPVLDVPMVLNDAGAIGYSLNGKSFPATAPYAVQPGEWIKVDYMNEGLQIHPMHLHGMPQLVIAKDGYPLANPSTEDVVTVAPGERYTVLVHATEPGAWVWHCHILPHAENDQGMIGMVTALIVQ